VVVTSRSIVAYLGDGRPGEIIRDGVLIGGWVAMWRPLEVFLYDWWPARAEGRLLQRLSTMPVRIEYKETAGTDAWRADWPEVPVAEVSRELRTRKIVPNVERVMASEKTGHEHSPEEERRIREAALDETIADSFPASDPASSDPNPDDHSALERARPTVADVTRRSP